MNRPASVVACLLHALFISSNKMAVYGADRFAQMSLFYLIFSPAYAAWSLDSLWRNLAAPSCNAGSVLLRVIQIHLCLAYFSSAFDKFQGTDWRSGEAVWRALMLPKFSQVDMSWLSRVPWLGRTLSWGTLGIEGGYAMLVWSKKTRVLWVSLTVALHLGIALGLGLYVFSALMIALTLTAFFVPYRHGRQRVPLATAILKSSPAMAVS